MMTTQALRVRRYGGPADEKKDVHILEMVNRETSDIKHYAMRAYLPWSFLTKLQTRVYMAAYHSAANMSDEECPRLLHLSQSYQSLKA